MKEKSQFSYSKQIVFINQSSGTLMVDIVNAFGIKYEKLVLITIIVFTTNYSSIFYKQ